MPVSCSAYGCTNRLVARGSVKFHRFPVCNDDLMKKWSIAVRRKGFVANSNSRLCSDHFIQSDYLCLGQQKSLKPDAIPSVFPAFPSYYQPKPKISRKPRCTQLHQSTLPSEGTVPDMISLTEESENKIKDACVQTNLSGPSYKVLKLKVKTLQQKVRRRNLKIKTLSDLLKTCKNKGLLESGAFNYLIQQFDGFSLELFKNQCINGTRKSNGVRFSEDIKKFAITLHYHSPRAYRFVRKFLKLPHEKSITNWVSGIDAEPGFFKQVFAALGKLKEGERDCNLVLDGMAIRKQIIWDSHNDCFIGYSDYGQYLKVECPETPATEVLTFMLVSVSGAWKWPVGYFLHQKCSANIQTELIRTAIFLATEAGLRVWGVTCDGTSTNFSSMLNLGCITYGEFKSLKPYFELNSNKIYFLPDACHMLKLARNALASARKFVSKDGLIDWGFVEKLHQVQSDITFKFANRLTKTHVEWHKNKMKVKLAAQTMSSSVADAIQFLKDQGVEGFEGSNETIRFIKIIDELFDFLNSRTPFGKGFKKPIYENNINFLEARMVENAKYLFSLKDVKGTPLFSGPKKTFVIGFGLTILSVIAISKQLLSSGKQKYLLTYKFSQDHLELLFSRIRKRHGSNNNPNVLQLKSAFKKILLKNDVSPSAASNCLALDDDPAGSIFEIKWSSKSSKTEDLTDPFDEGSAVMDEEMTELSSYCSTIMECQMRDNVLYYISGYIVRKISSMIDCTFCKKALLESHREHSYSAKYKHCKFVNSKNRGGLVSPSYDVLTVVKAAEKEICLSTDNLKNYSQKNITSKIVVKLSHSLVCNKNVFQTLTCEEEMAGKVHRLEIVKLILNTYCKIRMFSLAKIETEKKNTVSKRSILNKTVLFMNQ